MAGMTTRRLLVCASATGLAVLAGLPAAAQQDWVGTAGTLFFDTDTNWNPVQVPISDVGVTFGTVDVGGKEIIIGASSGTSSFDVFNNDWEFTGAAGGTLSTGTVTVNDDTGTTLANGTNVLASNGLVWSSGSPAYVGTTGYGSMTFSGGSDFLMRQLFVGDGANGVGEFTITGTGSLVRASLDSNTGVFTIGRGGGTGTFNVLDGAEMRTSSTGGNDIWVGGYSSDDDGPAPINSTGTLNVDGTGSFVETEDLNVGIFGGTGLLNITNGGNVTLTDGGSPDVAFGANLGFAGAPSQGTGVVDGDDSLLNARSIFVGNAGVGSLTVSNGGEARTRIDSSTPSDIYIGNSAGSSGKVAVYGTATDGTTASRLDSEDSLFVGNAGVGVLNVGLDLADNPVGSGALQVDGDLIIGDDAGNNGANKVVISGPNTTANIGGIVRAGNFGTGTLEVLNGATMTIGSSIGAAGVQGGNGSILISGPGTTVTAVSLFTGNGNNTAASIGSMTISNQAVLSLTGTTGGVITLGDDNLAVGTLTVTGSGSQLSSAAGSSEWWIGGSSNEDGGVGTLNVLNGGLAVSPVRIVQGYRGGAIGNVNVSGAGSQLDANGDYILVGFQARGNLNVTNGGVVNANRIFVADAAGSADSEMNIDGVGSVVNIAKWLHVGDTNRGLASVTNGGVLNVATDGINDRLIVGDEGGADGSKLTIDGAGSLVDYFGTDRISIGLSGGSTTDRATLEVLNGGVLNAVQRDGSNSVTSSGFLMVADETGSNGQVTVDGAGSRIDVRYMHVGDGPSSATAIVDITGGGVITTLDYVEVGSNGNGQGTVNVDGPGSQLLVEGYLSLGDDVPTNGSATGTLNITDGGYVSNAGQAYIGHYSGSFGTATLDSSTANDSVWDIGGELTIAGTESSSQNAGSGTLNANTGGVVNIASNLRVRNLGDLNLAGGTVNIGGDLILTDAGSTINFVFGKLAFNDPGGTALSPSELDRILAVGGGNRPTLFTNQEIAIAGQATIGGPLRIFGGTLTAGTLSAGSLVQVDFDTGTLNLTDTALTVGAGGLFGENHAVTSTQTLNIGLTTTIDAGSALTVLGSFSSGGLTNNGDLVVINGTVGGPVHSAAGTGLTVIGDATFTGDVSGGADFGGTGTATFAGGYAPGDSAAQIAFDGGVAFDSTNVLEIELGGLTPGTQHDQLVIAGDAQLGGELALSLIGGFTPTVGDSFTILTSAGLNGTTFDTITGGGLGLGLVVSYTATDVIVTAGRPGDLDMDGDVDGVDLGLAFTNFTGPAGTGKDASTGDLDGDGDVDGVDLAQAFSNFTGPLSPANVPEPGSLVILMSLTGLLSRRRR